MKKTTWNTYATYCYTFDAANDQRSAGGVHQHQVRKAASGWQKHIRQSNGTHAAYGPVSPISDADRAFGFIDDPRDEDLAGHCFTWPGKESRVQTDASGSRRNSGTDWIAIPWHDTTPSGRLERMKHPRARSGLRKHHKPNRIGRSYLQICP